MAIMKIKRIKVQTLLIIMAIFAGCAPEKESPLKAYYDSHNIPGAIMGYATKNGDIKFESFGTSRWGGSDPIRADNIFRLFSMTKAIASVGAMQLVEEGKLSLDAPLNELMPEMDSIPMMDATGKLVVTHDTITLRQLLTHTSGFGYAFMSPRLDSVQKANPVWKYKDLPRLFKPGTMWQYGTSTDWVGRIIEKVSGKSLEDYLREKVTGPLGMNSTWFNVPAALQDKIVSFGQRDSAGFKEFPRVPEPTKTYSAGGGLFGSPNDYMRFVRCMANMGELDGVRILKAETVEMMMKDHLPAEVKVPAPLTDEGLIDGYDRFGLAWAVEANQEQKIRPLGAVFWAGAANSYYTIDPVSGTVVVYFSNFFPFNDPEAMGLYKEMEKVAFGTGAQ